MNKDAIIACKPPESTTETEQKTELTLKGLLDSKDQTVYDKLTAKLLKINLIDRYMLEFCSHRNHFPTIEISEFIDENLADTEVIRQEDIPPVDKEKDMNVVYQQLSDDGKHFIPTSNQETFKLSAFKISANNLDKNEVKLTSKGEIVSEPRIELNGISAQDTLDRSRYLFLISGDYLNNKDNDSRGMLNIQTRKEYQKENSDFQDMLCTEGIFIDDIQEETNKTITAIYDNIRSHIKDKEKGIEELQEMFLLNPETIKTVKITLSDPEEKILEKVYSADAKIIAHKDVEIKKCIEMLDDLDPSSNDYLNNLNNLTSQLVISIPQQNRTALTHYVARRKLVLDVFDKILKNELKSQESGSRNIDERLLHNLIFQQSSDSPEESDLWLINEDFIYFKGTSETKLCDVEIDGKKVFKSEFFAEEEEYLMSLGENRKIKRPDILLFPDEGKCIIIELKNPEVNVSDHLTQINKYASLIMNYSESVFSIDTFYGFLIGQGIVPAEVRAADSDYKLAYHFDYLFRPHKTIAGEHGRQDGSLYCEVIKYSTLLQRAIRRNAIFINKLTDVEKKQLGEEQT